MNKWNKLLIVVLCLAMLLAIVPTVNTVNAAGEFGISAGTAGGTAGSEVAVDITLKNNPGFTALNMALLYDTEYLTQKSVENKVADLAMSAGPSLVWDGVENYTEDGTLATVKFQIASDAPAGDYEIKLVFWDASNEDLEEVSAMVIPGKITVECSHIEKTEVHENAPTCMENGNYKYYTCSCGDVFKADGVTETTVENETIPALKHDFSEKIEDAAHLVSGSGGNCQEVKVYYYDCIRCDAIGTAAFDGTTTGEHQMESTWTSENGKHYHKCSASSCTHIEDEASCFGGTATCLNKAVCAACDQEYGALAVCDFTGEKAEEQYLKQEANCQAAAVYYMSCTVCGKAGTGTFSYGEADSSNHIGGTELRDAAEASCTVDGYTGDTWCKGCDTRLETGTVIPSGHKLKKIAYVPATHEAPGNVEYYFCSVCDKLLADEQATTELTADEVIIPQGEHDYGDDYCADENNHWKECECGSRIKEGAHSYGAWETVLQPTANSKGSRERSCTVCGDIQTDELPAISTPATGDNSQLILWITLLIFSACGLFLTVLLIPYKKGKYLK